MSQLSMRASKKRFMTSIGIVRGENQAYVEAAIVLVRRIQVLVKQGIREQEIAGYLSLSPDTCKGVTIVI